MTNPDVLAKRLLHRAHNRDGLPEILLGFLFLAVSGVMYSWTVLNHHSLLFRASVLLYAFGFPTFCFLSPRLLRWIRNRFLVERAGYVEPLPGPSLFRRAWAAGVGAVLIVLVLVTQHPPGYWVTGVTGVGSGILAAICGRGPRFYVAGLIMAATGLAVAFARMPMEAGFAVIFGIQGAAELISGGIAWRAAAHER